MPNSIERETENAKKENAFLDAEQRANFYELEKEFDRMENDINEDLLRQYYAEQLSWQFLYYWLLWIQIFPEIIHVT